MKNKKKTITLIAFTAIVLGLPTKCTVEPTYYSQVSPETFFDSQDRVYQRFARVLTHWAWMYGTPPFADGVLISVLSTDEIIMPARGQDWYDEGYYLNHTDQNKYAEGTDGEWSYCWTAFSQGVAQAYSAMEDIDANVDFDALGFPAGAKESMLNQLKVIIASFYMCGLDNFGGVPLYTSNQSDLLPRSTDKETFAFIENLLKEALPTLPKRKAGEASTGYPTQGIAAALLARLYFNAKPYMGTEMYTQCADICTKIKAGDYGYYALASSFQDIFGFGNDNSDELIWAIPSENGKRQVGAGVPQYSTHYTTANYLDNASAMSWNGFCLIPSLDINGKSYVTETGNLGGPFKLGSPYAKFHADDLRKKNYLYLGGGKYEGMFLAGKLINPNATTTSGVCTADGSREYKAGDTIPMVDQIAQLAPDKSYPNGRMEGGLYAEENSGVRLLKYSPIPNTADAALRYNPDVPIIRFTEIQYMLAECKWRAGQQAEAANLINEVRARYFVDTDPDPVPASFDDYRFLDEWLIEFLGEGRRRTDLVRFDKFVTEDWWDHKASKDPNKNRFPIFVSTRQANPKLEQNPGY